MKKKKTANDLPAWVHRHFEPVNDEATSSGGNLAGRRVIVDAADRRADDGALKLHHSRSEWKPHRQHTVEIECMEMPGRDFECEWRIPQKIIA